MLFFNKIQYIDGRSTIEEEEKGQIWYSQAAKVCSMHAWLPKEQKKYVSSVALTQLNYLINPLYKMLTNQFTCCSHLIIQNMDLNLVEESLFFICTNGVIDMKTRSYPCTNWPWENKQISIQRKLLNFCFLPREHAITH